MTYIAPNLSSIIGASTAAKLMGAAGGLTALSKVMFQKYYKRLISFYLIKSIFNWFVARFWFFYLFADASELRGSTWSTKKGVGWIFSVFHITSHRIYILLRSSSKTSTGKCLHLHVINPIYFVLSTLLQLLLQSFRW